MAELKCPHCGQAFTVDDAELGSIISQIRDAQFEQDVNSRLNELTGHMQEKHALEMSSLESKLRMQIQSDHEKELKKLGDNLRHAEDKAKDYALQIEHMEDRNKLAIILNIIESLNC